MRQTQPRVAKIAGDQHGSADPIRWEAVMSYLEWQRAEEKQRSPVESTNSHNNVTTGSCNHGGYEAERA